MEHTKHAYHTLLVEVALDVGYRLRVERRASNGQMIIGIGSLLSRLTSADPWGVGVLVTPVADSSEVKFDLEGVERLSFVTDHLPSSEVVHGDLQVGDPVHHRQFGLEVIAAFASAPSGRLAVVRFAGTGPKKHWVEPKKLTRVETSALAS